MIDAGDIVLADLRREVRHRVIVVSNARFNRLSDRAIVVPEFVGALPQPAMPWQLPVGDGIYLIDAMLSVERSALLDVVGRATTAELELIRRALTHITT